MSRKIVLPALSVQAPFGSMIISGEKRIETRTYGFPEKYLGKDLYLVETPGKNKALKSGVIGIIRVHKFWAYENEVEFRNDLNLHLVSKGSAWDWQKSKPKWAWEIKVISKFPSPKSFTSRLGIRFTQHLELD